MSFNPLQPRIIYANGVQNNHTGDTVLTTLATYTVKGQLMGPRDELEIFCIYSCNNNANNKTCAITIGGSTVVSLAITTVTCFARGVFWQNRNSVSAQACNDSSQASTFGSLGAKVSTAIDTSQNFIINFNGTLANAADSVAIEMVKILLWTYP